MRLGVAAGPFRSLAVARRDGAEQGPVLVGERWSVDLAAQGSELVALVLAARGRGLYRLETSAGHS